MPEFHGVEKFASTLAEISLNPSDFILPKFEGRLSLSNNSKVRNGLTNCGLITRKNQAIAIDLPSMLTCPGMGRCGRECYAFSIGRTYQNVRRVQEHNFGLVLSTYRTGGVNAVTELIVRSVMAHKQTKVVRIHAAGDFFSAWYLEAWVKVAQSLPFIRFYAYTKSFHILWNVYNRVEWPSNLIINLSIGTTPEGESWQGGLFDQFIEPLRLAGFNVVSVVWDDGDPALPWNDEERIASTPSSVNGGSKPDFKIGIHSVWYTKETKYHQLAGEVTGVHHC